LLPQIEQQRTTKGPNALEGGLKNDRNPPPRIAVSFFEAPAGISPGLKTVIRPVMGCVRRSPSPFPDNDAGFLVLEGHVCAYLPRLEQRASNWTRTVALTY
jgi:hypothetical protein